MTRLVFAALFGLNFLLFLCKGQISLPPGGDSFAVLPGENVILAWKLDVSLSAVLARSWTFLPNNESFADIGGNADVVKKTEYAPGTFTIKKPSTLILENVTPQYSGIYRFGIFANGKFTESDVTVTVAGQISLPPGGDNFVVLPGENVTLAWKLDVSLSTVLARSWTFLPNNESFAEIGGNAGVVPNPEYAPGPFTIEKPATLILENVTIQYSGIYRFTIFASNKLTKSDVTVTVAVKPNVIINCTNPLTISEGKDFICLCEAKNGKPPADVTWEKDGVLEPGGTGKEQKILTRVNVSGVDSGTYTCVGKSHTLTNTKSIEVKVNAKPNAMIELNPKRVPVGGSVTITCTSRGFPEPKYNITHNGTEVSTEKTYIILDVEWKHAGTYKCFVWNILGNDSDSDYLTAEGPIPGPLATTPTSERSTEGGNRTAANKEDDGTVVVWHVVVSLLSGIIIGFLLSHIVSCSRRRWSKNRKRQSNPEAQTTEVDTTYQELDLSKMNAEDSYQSLRVNAVNNDTANDDDSTYTELNKARDVENNYQSLTH